MKYYFLAFLLMYWSGPSSIYAGSNDVTQAVQEKKDDNAGDESILDYLSKSGMQIRKSFSGSNKELGTPASLSYIDSNIAGTFYSADVAIKIANWESDGPQSTFLIFPVVEWHKTTAESAESSKVSAGLNAEYYLDFPFFVFQSKLVRDLKADQTSAQASILASLFDQNYKYGPGNPIRTASEDLIARYYPYLGLEYFNNLPYKQAQITLSPSVTASFATGRLYLELFPFNKLKSAGQFQIIGTYTYREKIGGDLSKKNFKLMDLSVLYYFDDKLRSAIGFDYEHGENPETNFLTNNKSSLSLKLKL